jgi:hypothetical protein
VPAGFRLSGFENEETAMRFIVVISKILSAIIVYISLSMTFLSCGRDNPTASDDRIQRNFTINVTVLSGGVAAARRQVVFAANKTDVSGNAIAGQELSYNKATDSEGNCEWSFVYRLNSSEKVEVRATVEEGGVDYSQKAVFSWTGETTKSITISL